MSFIEQYKEQKHFALGCKNEEDLAKYDQVSGASLPYDQGFIEAIKMFGIWKDGTQRIGCLEHPVRDLVTQIRNLREE